MKTIWRIYKYLAITVVTLFLIDAVFVLSFSFFHPHIQKADAIIILGAAINTPALYNRSLEGLRLYKEGDADVVVLSGGRISDADISEAQYMQKVIKKNSSSTVPTLMDEQSHDTYENIKNSKSLIPNDKSVIIVSDQFHLARGVLMAYREGFRHIFWSSPKPYYYKKSELVFYYVREIVAMVAYIPKFILG